MQPAQALGQRFEEFSQFRMGAHLDIAGHDEPDALRVGVHPGLVFALD